MKNRKLQIYAALVVLAIIFTIWGPPLGTPELDPEDIETGAPNEAELGSDPVMAPDSSLEDSDETTASPSASAASDETDGGDEQAETNSAAPDNERNNVGAASSPNRRSSDYPPTVQSGTLSRSVYEAIAEIQARLQDDQPEAARNELDALYATYDNLNDFEKSTLLNFYVNYLLGNDMISEALVAFEQMLEIETLRPESRDRALMALGQLYQQEEEYENSVDAFQELLAVSGEPGANAFRGLAVALYNLERHQEAIPYMEVYVSDQLAAGAKLGDNIYNFLTELYTETGDYNAAVELGEFRIQESGSVADWRTLATLYENAGDEGRSAAVIERARAEGFVNERGQWADQQANQQ